MTPQPGSTHVLRLMLLTLFLAALVASAAAQSPTVAPWPGPTAAGYPYITRHQAASADKYLDQHPQIARELQRDPRLIDNPNYLAAHPSLQNYLRNHPEVRQDWKQHPYAFEKRERQYERNEYRKPYSAFR